MINTNVNNRSAIVQLLEFEALFPKEIPLEPEEYLKGGSKKVILQAASFFLAFKQWDSKYSDNKVFLSDFFGKDNKEFLLSILDKINKIEKEGKGKE